MDRVSKGIIAILIVCVAFLLLYMIQPMARVVVWSNTHKTVLWAEWAEAVKVFAPLVASTFFFYMLFTKSILQSARKSVTLIMIGTFLFAVGASIEMAKRLEGIDATALNPASIAYIFGAIFIMLSIISFQQRIGVTLKTIQKFIFISSLVLFCAVTCVVIVGPYYFSPESVKLEFVLKDIIIQVVYAIMVLLNFAVALRLSLIFSKGKIGRPFRLISAGILSLSIYEYIVWIPTTQIDVFNPLNIFWIACFLLGIVGVYDLSYK